MYAPKRVRRIRDLFRATNGVVDVDWYVEDEQPKVRLAVYRTLSPPDRRVFRDAQRGAGVLGAPAFFLFTAFVGLNLFQSGLTNWCPMVSILKACGVKSCAEEKAQAAGR